MSFLNLRKKKKEPPAPAKTLVPGETSAKKLMVAGAAASVAKGKADFNPEVLRRPYITEKAASGASRGVYVFEVSTTANKREIAEAVSLFYKVTPIKVSVVAIPAKRITVKGRIGFRKGGKKAYVHLKKGEKIELV